jgi:hypothetical protein
VKYVKNIKKPGKSLLESAQNIDTFHEASACGIRARESKERKRKAIDR